MNGTDTAILAPVAELTEDPISIPLAPGLIGPEPEATAPHLSRLSKARKAANHLISSSSLGAQSTKVRLAVTIRNVWSSEGDVWFLSVDEA
jgi:hypothetical protein